jgi:hypothetical protein
MVRLLNYNFAALLGLLFNGLCCALNAQTKPTFCFMAYSESKYAAEL